MLRSAAVKLINRDLGYRPDGWAREPDVITCLQEAQNDLENGKTLPPFLLAEDQPLVLAAGAHSAPYPSGFLRDFDENLIHYVPTPGAKPKYLARRMYTDAITGQLSLSTDPRAPSVYVLRKNSIDFITAADKTYNLLWDYYKRGDLLSSDIENVWLAHPTGSVWLCGEAGYRMALSLRDASAADVFDKRRTMGRAATFGEILADETSSAPMQMGANN